MLLLLRDPRECRGRPESALLKASKKLLSKQGYLELATINFYLNKPPTKRTQQTKPKPKIHPKNLPEIPAGPPLDGRATERLRVVVVVVVVVVVRSAGGSVVAGVTGYSLLLLLLLLLVNYVVGQRTCPVSLMSSQFSASSC